MASSSSIPSVSFTDAGVVLPTETEILTAASNDLDVAFGGGLNFTNEGTPQRQLADTITAIVSDKDAKIATIQNQVDPRYSSGRWQDGIGRIYFLTRKPAAATSVLCTLGGTAGASIPAGTLVEDTSGNTYTLTATATIGAAGTVTAEFQNTTTGPIPCPAGTLTTIRQAIGGWDTITNPSAGTVGRDVETRADFEYRRKNSVAKNGQGTIAAIYGAVADVDGVLDIYADENTTSSAVTRGSTNYSLLANSIYVAVVGGVDQDIGNAIWSKHGGGCDFNGNTTVTVSDTENYAYPYPSYTVKCHRPSSLALKFHVQILDNPNLPADVATLVKNAIVARFNGNDSSLDAQRERIGSLIRAARYYSTVSSINQYVSPVSILLGTTTADQATWQVGIDQRPVLSESDVTVELVL